MGREKIVEEIAVPVEEVVVSVPVSEIATFTCQRCGFVYQKNFDHPPYLCHRCLRFLAKGVYTLYNKLQPSTSTPTPTET